MIGLKLGACSNFLQTVSHGSWGYRAICENTGIDPEGGVR